MFSGTKTLPTHVVILAESQIADSDSVFTFTLQNEEA